MSETEEYYDEMDLDGPTDYRPADEKVFSAWLAMLVQFGILLLMTFLMPVIFSDMPNDSFHVLITFMLAIISVISIGILTESKLKAQLGGALVTVVYFGLFFLVFRNIDAACNVLAPFGENSDLFMELIDNLARVSGENLDDAEPFLEMLWIVDFIFVFFIIMPFAAISLTWIYQVIVRKASALALVFALFFFLVGVIMLPYVLVSVAGTFNFVGNVGNGGIFMMEATDVIADAGGTLTQDQEDEVRALFENADEYFAAAQEQLESLESMGAMFLAAMGLQMVFNLMLGDEASDVDAQAIVDTLLPLMKAGGHMARGIGPLLIGMMGASSAVGDALGALGAGGSPMPLMVRDQVGGASAINASLFNANIEIMRSYFPDIREGLSHVENGMLELEEIDADEMNTAFDNNTEVIFDARDVFNQAIEGINLLISPFDPDVVAVDPADVKEPLVYLLYGAFATSSATEIIGDESNFNGVADPLRMAETNFSIVSEFCAEEAATQAAGAEAGDDDWQRTVPGLFHFLGDMAGTASISAGLAADVSEAFILLDNSMALFQDDNALGATDDEYTETIANLTQLVESTSEMNATIKNELDPLMAEMNANTVNNEVYGYLTDPAKEFVTVLETFDLSNNIETFFYVANALHALTYVLMYLSDVQISVIDVTEAADALNTAIETTNTTGAIEAAADMEKARGFTNANLTLADPWIGFMAANLSLIEGDLSSQLETTVTALTNIANELPNIQTQLDNIDTAITAIEDALLIPDWDVITTNLTAINEEYIPSIQGSLDTITGEMNYVNTGS